MKLKRRREQRAATREEKELKRRQVSGELSDAKNAELTKNKATTFGLEPDQSSLVTRTHTLEKDHFSSFTVSAVDAPSLSTIHGSQFVFLRVAFAPNLSCTMPLPRTILITGCSSGCGRDAAFTLREQGWRVFASCRRAVDCDALRAEGFESPRIDYQGDPATTD
jgi:hypothetical protein